MPRVSRSVETGFQYVLGILIKNLFVEWQQYYNELYTEESQDSYLPGEEFHLEGKKVLKKVKNRREYSELQISPDGVYAAFAPNETGKYKVWLHELQTEKLKKLFVAGYKPDEKIDYSYPLLSWHPTGRILPMVMEKKGLIWVYFYDVDEHKWTS